MGPVAVAPWAAPSLPHRCMPRFWFAVCCQLGPRAAVTHSCGFLLHLWFQRSLLALFGHPLQRARGAFNFLQKLLHTQLFLLSLLVPAGLLKGAVLQPGTPVGLMGCPQPTLLGQELRGTPGFLPTPSGPFLRCCSPSGRSLAVAPVLSSCSSCLSGSPGLCFSHISWEGGGSVPW